VSSHLAGRSPAWLQQVLGRTYRAVLENVRFFFLNILKQLDFAAELVKSASSLMLISFQSFPFF
jgi:hypothetical protein